MAEAHAGRTALRSRMVGTLRPDDRGSTVRLAGWVHRRRDLGSLVFVDLRDRSGLVQVSFGPEWTEERSIAAAGSLGREQVIAVEGEVAVRPEANPELPTGEVEVRARRLELLSPARTPAIPVYRGPDEDPPSEEQRLRHRVLDLRRPELQAALALRHRLALATRTHLDSLGFLEIETPILTRPTPEGARDYLVPSRVHPGEFYALPQSPQLYKQILVTAGFDRYFQIARCFRDEDLRADRQPEFTQIDLEASFVGMDDVMGWTESLMSRLAEVGGIEAPLPFRRLTYREALERFGTDRPDLRWSLEIEDWSSPLGELGFRIIDSALEAGGRARGLRLEGGADLSRKSIESVEEAAKAAGAPGLLWAKRAGDGGSGPLARFLSEEAWGGLGMEAGDLALVAAGDDRVTSPALDAARRAALAALEVPPEGDSAWAWVTDFPLFEPDERGEPRPTHHPFVEPYEDDLERLDSDPFSVRGRAYDLVYNGTELGGGSLRIHRPELQRRMLAVLGMDGEEADRRFGFLLGALEAGAPPHGGIALGLDRIVQNFAGVPSLRDVIAFPKTTAARALFEGAPAPVGEDDLEELHIRVSRPD